MSVRLRRGRQSTNNAIGRFQYIQPDRIRSRALCCITIPPRRYIRRCAPPPPSSPVVVLNFSFILILPPPPQLSVQLLSSSRLSSSLLIPSLFLSLLLSPPHPLSSFLPSSPHNPLTRSCLPLAFAFVALAVNLQSCLYIHPFFVITIFLLFFSSF